MDERGQPWPSSFLTRNAFENCESIITQSLDEGYEFSINLRHLSQIPNHSILIRMLYIEIIS